MKKRIEAYGECSDATQIWQKMGLAAERVSGMPVQGTDGRKGAPGKAMNLQDLLAQLFPKDCKTVTSDWLVTGEAVVAGKPVSIVGTTNHTFIGVREVVALSEKFLDIVEKFPGRPIIMLVDNNGQRMALDEELLALPEYIAHLLKTEQVARLAGCKLIAIVYGNTGGGWLHWFRHGGRIASCPYPGVRPP